MKVLAVNCGSSTLKFRLVEADSNAAGGSGERRLASGMVERIGPEAALACSAVGAEPIRQRISVADHGAAMRHVIAWLGTLDLAAGSGLDAIGHRVVHGGARFQAPAVIDDSVVDAIAALTELAPLHNGPALAAIRAARAALGAQLPMVAVFDTAFHRTMPDRAAHYAIARELVERDGIRRYGFHGLAHRAMTERYAALTGTPLARVRLVTLQLGNGCSAAAIDGGRSIDTSMGFTPLEGLMMGSRSGDIDPSVVAYLVQHRGVDAATVQRWLNRESGLLGVSGRSADMRELLDAEARGDARAGLAVEMFCYRARKYVGAYLAALGGASALVFGGGIGEHAPAIRARICAGMAWCGLTLDGERNARAVGTEGRISSDGSTLHAYVIPVDEEALIVRDTVRSLVAPGRARSSISGGEPEASA